LDTRRRADRAQPDRGFTLIEVVIALAIISITVSFVLPRLAEWIDRLAFSMRQQQFEDALAGLGTRARQSGRTLVLRSTGSAPGLAEAIEVPSTWDLRVEPPVAFRYDGVCTGGTVRLNFPGGEKTYRLQAPYCRPEKL
jgi:prepilin-type N-terminal cleavage/methylation domain-containing protein